MAQWRKVVVSGSNAVLNQISASGNIVPTSDNGVDLGSAALEFKDLYIDGNANVDTLKADTAAIGDLTSGRVVFAGTGGELEDSSNFTFATDTLTATKIGAFEAAGAIDFSDENMTNVDIDSGAIDGVTIGGASAGAITGTTIDATTDFTIGGTVITDNTITDDGTLVIASTTATSFSDGNITNVGSIALDSIAADDGSSFTISNNWTNAGNTIADLGSVTTCDINGGTITGITDLVVADGGTGASSLTQNGVLIGNGTSAVTAVDLSTDGAIVVGDGSGNPTSLDIGSSTAITILGTIATGVWNGTAITGTYIGNDAIDSQHYADASIDHAHLANDIIDGDNIQDDVINSEHYAAGSIDNEHLADDAVDSDELAAGAVDDAHLSDGVATGLAGAGMTATSGVMNVIGTAGAVSVGADAVTLVAANTTLTSIINGSLGKIGTNASQEYITFGTSDEVNTFIDNTEVLSVRSGGVDITGVATVSSNLTVGGNLDVNGTLTTIDSSNTTIADKFMIIASGSASATDGGIIVQGSNTAGYALGYDSGTSRWVFDNNLAHSATDIAPDAYVGTVELGTTHGDSQSAPTYGSGVGSIYVDTDDAEIWIYA